MAFYRFPPPTLRGTFLAVSGCVLAVLALPALVNANMTLPQPQLEKVTLAAPGSKWEVPVPDLYCTPNSDTMATLAWNCGKITVQAVLQQGVDADSEELALRRAIRGYGFGSVSTAQVYSQDGGHLLFDEPTATAALSRAGEGDSANDDYLLLIGPDPMAATVTVDGQMLGDIERISQRLWNAFGSAELPAGFTGDIEAPFNGQLPAPDSDSLLQTEDV